jgi:hypothetical protein
LHNFSSSSIAKSAFSGISWLPTLREKADGLRTAADEHRHKIGMGLYCDVFSDVVLRQAIENYIVELVENRTRFVQRKPTPRELRSENLRSTVTKAAQLLDEYRKKKPEIATKYIALEKRDGS